MGRVLGTDLTPIDVLTLLGTFLLRHRLTGLVLHWLAVGLSDLLTVLLDIWLTALSGKLVTFLCLDSLTLLHWD